MMDFYRDKFGDPRARGDGALASLLESDLQGSACAVRDILMILEKDGTWTGNAYDLSLFGGIVSIEPLYDAVPDTLVAWNDFRDQVLKWGAFLDGNGETA